MPIELQYRDGSVAELVLDNPERLNAFTLSDLDAAIEAVDAAGATPAVRALLVRGTGRGFCAGADLTFLTGLDGADRSTRSASARPGIDLVLRLVRFPRPVIGVVHGPAYGGGACVALACDHVIAAEDARFGLVFTRLGLPGGDMVAPWLLSRRVGTRPAWDLLAQAAVLNAGQAAELGLVDAVLGTDAALEVARTRARDLAAGPAEALAATKAQILDLEGGFEELDEAVRRQQETIADAFDGAEFREAIAAHRDGRQPRFQT